MTLETRRALVAGLCAAIAVDLLFISMVMHDGRWAAHIGPFRLRIQDELRLWLAGLFMILTVGWLERRSRAWRVALVSTLAFFAVVGLLALARHAEPVREVSDGAILEIYTLEALRGKLLVGPYSRFGWHHPGPLYLYLQAPWYWLSGYKTAGMQAGALAMNLAALAATIWTVARFGDGRLAISVAAFLAYYVVRAGELPVSVWNPHVIVLPTVACIVLAATFAATGRPPLLMWLVFVGSFLVQTHLALGPVVAGLVGVSATAQWAAVRRAFNRAAWLVLALWLLPIVEQLSHSPGNLTKIWRFFVTNPPAGQRAAGAAAAWATSLAASFGRGFKLAWGFVFTPPDTPWALVFAVVQLALLAVAATWAHRTGRTFVRWVTTLGGVSSLIALVATSRIQGRIADHEVFWISTLGALNASLVVGVAVMAIGEVARTRRALPALGVTIVGLCAFFAAAGSGVRQMRYVLERSAQSPDDRAVDALVFAVHQSLSETGARRPLFAIEPSAWYTAAGALLQIDKAGIPFAVDERWTTMFGESFAPTGREDARWTIAGSNRRPVLVSRLNATGAPR